MFDENPLGAIRAAYHQMENGHAVLYEHFEQRMKSLRSDFDEKLEAVTTEVNTVRAEFRVLQQDNRTLRSSVDALTACVKGNLDAAQKAVTKIQHTVGELQKQGTVMPGLREQVDQLSRAHDALREQQNELQANFNKQQLFEKAFNYALHTAERGAASQQAEGIPGRSLKPCLQTPDHLSNGPTEAVWTSPVATPGDYAKSIEQQVEDKTMDMDSHKTPPTQPSMMTSGEDTLLSSARTLQPDYNDHSDLDDHDDEDEIAVATGKSKAEGFPLSAQHFPPKASKKRSISDRRNDAVTDQTITKTARTKIAKYPMSPPKPRTDIRSGVQQQFFALRTPGSSIAMPHDRDYPKHLRMQSETPMPSPATLQTHADMQVAREAGYFSDNGFGDESARRQELLSQFKPRKERISKALPTFTFFQGDEAAAQEEEEAPRRSGRERKRKAPPENYVDLRTMGKQELGF